MRALCQEIGTSAPEPRQSVEGLCRAAWYAWERGDKTECESFLERALCYAGDSEARIEAKRWRALIAFLERDIERGETLVDAVGDPQWLQVTRALAHIAYGSAHRGVAILQGIEPCARDSAYVASFYYFRGNLVEGQHWEEIARTRLGSDARIEARAAVARVSALRLTIEGRFKAAELCWEGIWIPGDEGILRSLKHHGAGWRALTRGDFDVAVAELNRALELWPHTGSIRGRVAILVNLIEAKRGGGQVELEEAIALAHRLPVDDGARVGVLLAQGVQYLDREQRDEGLEFVREAQRLQQNHLGPAGLHQTRLSMVLGRALAEHGRLDEARDEMSRGVTVARALYGAGHPTIAYAERCLASIPKR